MSVLYACYFLTFNSQSNINYAIQGTSTFE